MDNRKYVEALMEAVLYCSLQGIAFRRHDESDALSNPGNFKSLMRLISSHSSVVQNRLHDDSKKPHGCLQPFKMEIFIFCQIGRSSASLHQTVTSGDTIFYWQMR